MPSRALLKSILKLFKYAELQQDKAIGVQKIDAYLTVPIWKKSSKIPEIFVENKSLKCK